MTDDFDIGAFDAQDEAMLTIKHPKTGEATTWTWTFFGPGHPETVKIAERISRKFLHEERDKEAARVNGRKWKREEEAPAELRRQNIANILDRTKSFSPVNLNGKLIEYSRAAAEELLLDPKKSWLFGQISDFLREDASFIRPSGKA